MKNGKWFPGATGQHKSGEFHVHNGMNKCICVGNTGSFEEAKANANLIASAPEMLEMLKEILDAYIETDDCDLSELLYRKINDIIAKAGGE